MPYYVSIAFKNIFRDPRRSITLGINYFFITLLLFTLFAVTAGMKQNISDNVISSAAGHITISGEYIVKGKTSQGIAEYPRIVSAVKELFPDAEVLTRYTMSSAVYHNNLSKRISFTGIAAESDSGLKDQISLEPGVWESFLKTPNGVIMARSQGEYFGLKPKDDLLIAARTRLGAFNTGTLQVIGVHKTGNYFLRDLVLCHYDFLQKLDLADSVTASKMYIFFNSIKESEINRELLLKRLNTIGFIANKPASQNDALNAVSAASPRYPVKDESVNEKRLTLATADEVTGIVSQVIGAINGIGMFIAGIMLFIISISIFINMRMTINERMQEIGTLRAMGAERSTIVKLFIFENLFLSLIFIASGIIAGFLIVALFSYGITVPADGALGLFVHNGHFVLKPTLCSICFIVLILTFFTALFSFFPARYGGKVPAVVALNKTN